MKMFRSCGLLLTVLMLSMFSMASSAAEVIATSFENALDIGSGLDLAPASIEKTPTSELIYISAPERTLDVVLLTPERIESPASDLIEFAVITSTVDQSVTVAGGC